MLEVVYEIEKDAPPALRKLLDQQWSALNARYGETFLVLPQRAKV